MTPTIFGWEKRDSNQSFKRSPIKPVGIEAMIIMKRILIPSSFLLSPVSLDLIP
jgi:hypothetical protein